MLFLPYGNLGMVQATGESSELKGAFSQASVMKLVETPAKWCAGRLFGGP